MPVGNTARGYLRLFVVEFVSRYQANTTAESFVDALIKGVRAAGFDLGGERANLINSYKGSGITIDQLSPNS